MNLTAPSSLLKSWALVLFVLLGFALSTAFTQARESAQESPQNEVRTWTNLEGREIQAQLKEVKDAQAVLLVNGREAQVPLTQLSQADQKFIEQWQKGAAKRLERPYGEKGLRFPPKASRTQPLEAEVPESFARLEKVEVEELGQADEGGVFQYQSEHYFIESERELTSSLVEAIALMLECTYAAVEQMPWGMPISMGGREDGRILVGLYLDEASYVTAGGVPNSAGVAIGGRKFLCRLDFIGVRDTGRRLILDNIEESRVLTHEMTHILRNLGDRGLPIWAIEGFAEYMETYEYNDRGGYEVRDPMKRVGELQPRTVQVPVPLPEFFVVSRQQFYGGNIGQGGGLSPEAWKYYSTAMTLMTYFWHADKPKGAERVGEPIRNYLRAIYSGKETPAEARQHLLAGRSWKQLQDDITRAYSRHLQIEFPPLPEQDR